ncbi:hypothetical protein ABPG74_015365 [Tetrahymena malaccensis]
MVNNLSDLGSPSTHANKAGQPTFQANKISENVINQLFEQDLEGRNMRQQLKSSSETYKDNIQFANNHFGNDEKVKEVIFRAKKAFFNHKFSTQELLRSQHLYKLSHELKYTPEKNLKSYPDVLEDGYKEVLRVNDKDYEIRDALVKWYKHRLEMIQFVQKELQRQYFQTFACDLDDYSENSKNIGIQLKQSYEAQVEIEDVIRNLKSERFFRNSKQYERKHLPELSVVSSGNIIIEKTFAKALKNFPYITQHHIKAYFNDYVSQHYCTRKIKKIRLINDYLPYKIQFINTMKTAKQIQMHQKNNFNYEQDEMQREINKLYGVRRTYLLASDKSTIEKNVAEFSKQLGIKEDVNIDYGCLLLFAIDKKFETVINEQSETYLIFFPYDLKSPFMSMMAQKKFGDQATELMKTIESENKRKDNIKIRSCKTWIDKIQILQAEDSDTREQNAVFALYEDTLINGWLKFLLYSDENLINQKIQKDISVLKDRIVAIHKKQFEEIFYQFYQRYFKLLFIKSRKSVIKIMSYMNYFRCLQKNMNLAYVQLITGQSIEGFQEVKADAKYSEFDVSMPLYQQQEKLSQNKLYDEKFFLTNPSIANYGNLTEFNLNKGVKSSKEDYIKVGGQATVTKAQAKSAQKASESKSNNNKKKENNNAEEEVVQEEPNVLYEEEVITLENDIITIKDHNNMKIIFDTSVHDFHMILEKIGQICSFYFHFRIKHDMSQKDKDKGVFKDTFDREALIDIVLNLESQYYLNKVKLLRNLNLILKNTFYPDLRNQLIKLISSIMTRRPRMNLFENSIFQCYHFEIQNLQYFNEILEILIKDTEEEEDKINNLRHKLNPNPTDRLQIFLSLLKNPGHDRKFNFYTSSFAKLILNIEQNREQFSKLITSSQTEPSQNVSEILKCENAYFKELLDLTKKVVFDSDGSNLYLDFIDFRFIEKDETLDQPENFDLIINKVQTYIDERLSKAERDKLSFDAFSMLEFMKVRKKFNNFLFGLASLLETYRLQVSRVSEDFKEKFENSIDIAGLATTTLDAQRKNYLKLLLDLDAIKIAKDILVLDNWVVPITKQQSLVQLTQYLESLILCSQLTQNFVISNNIYFQSVLNDMPKEFFKKIKQSAPDFFKNVFDKKKAIANETITFVRNQELSKPKTTTTQEEGTGKILSIQVFCKRIKREVQFEAMKIQTLLQRNAIEKFSKKLPFETPIFNFVPLSPVKEVVLNINQVKDSLLDARTNAQLEEEIDSKGEVFFDTLGCAVKIFNMPSVEQINNMTHEDFEQVMERYGLNKLPELSDDDEYFADEDSKWEKSQTSGGKDWLKAQEQKLEKDICLLLPNKNIQVNKGSTTLKGYRKREFLQHQHLLYLRKTQLFVLWKILGNILNILSFCTFECSLEANTMDMLYFINGQLGYEKCKIETGGAEDNEQQQKSAPSIKTLKDLAMVNKKAIPIFKRNELRLRRDIENLKSLLERMEKNIQTIRNNPKIADSNDAIMSYLEKVQNRHFLSCLLLLIEQLNISREKEDYEFMFRLRSLIVDLNFPQIQHLARYEDGKILLAKNIDIDDDSADFTQSPDLKVYDSSSDFMNLIRVIFWDSRPKVEESLHSTIAILNPNRYFFNQFLRFGSILEKGLIGMPQSRVTELSVTKNSMDFIINNFLRNNFVFEQDDPFKFERMCTKIVNLQVRQYILREIYICRKMNILPFEIIPGNRDPLKQISKLIKDKIKISMEKNGLQSTLNVKQQIDKKANNGNDEQDQQPPPEENIILDICLNSFQVQTLMYQEAIQFYYEENLVMSKWINKARKKESNNQSKSMIVYDPLQINKAFSTGSLQVLDILSILSNFTTKVYFDSTEIKTLNKNEALVISKEDLQKHLHGINLDLIDLVEEKYSKSMHKMEQKCDILEKDVQFQKKWNKLLQKKIEFLEKNMQNIVESQVASRSNDLIYEIQHLQKKANYTADQRQIDKVRIFKEIQKNFLDQLRENEQVNENILSRFYDFRQGQKLEVFNMVEGIKENNYKMLKEAINKALEDHGGSSQALHAVDAIWNSTWDERREDEHKKKQNAHQQQVQLQQSQLQQQQQIVTSQRMMRTNHTEESVGHHEEEIINLQNTVNMMHPISQQNMQTLTQQNINLQIGANQMFEYNPVDTLPVDVYERIEFQNKEVYKLLSSFKLIRAFYNMKLACMMEKYERRIQQINENNSSNEQLYRDKKEMQAQTENMKEQVLSLKKTMAIMEYQNEILRRDVQRSRKERLKSMKVMKQKDDRIRALEEKVEQNLKERIATYNNIHSQTHISRNFSVQSMRKKHNKTLGNSLQNGGTLNQIDSSLVIQQQNGNILPQSTIKSQQYNLQNVNTVQTNHLITQSSQVQNQRVISSAHPVLANSQLSQSSHIQPNLQNKRPTTALITSKSTQLLFMKSSGIQKSENPTQRVPSPPMVVQNNYQSQPSQPQVQQQQPKKKHLHLSGLLTRPVSNQTTPANNNKQISNPKTLSMTYKIKSAINSNQQQQN